MSSDRLSRSSSDLNSRQKYAVLVSASLVQRKDDILKRDLQRALDHAFSFTELVELILQSLLFDGYPCALEGLIALKELNSSALPADESLEAYSTENLHLWDTRGKTLCKQIYGPNFNRLLQNVSALSPTLREWMLLEGYGRVLARPALSIDLREMGIIAILTVKGLPRQLHSHLRGALRVGVSARQLEDAIRLCAEYTTEKKITSALGVLRAIG